MIEYVKSQDRYVRKRELRVRFRVPVSDATISKIMHRNKLYARVPLRKIQMTHENKAYREYSAEQLMNLTYEDFCNWVFIDESGKEDTWNILGYQWRSTDTKRTDPENCRKTQLQNAQELFFICIDTRAWSFIFPPQNERKSFLGPNSIHGQRTREEVRARQL